MYIPLDNCRLPACAVVCKWLRGLNFNIGEQAAWVHWSVDTTRAAEAADH